MADSTFSPTRPAESDGVKSHRAVRELGVRTPSLEEIFVAYLELAERAEPAHPSAAEAVVP